MIGRLKSSLLTLSFISMVIFLPVHDNFWPLFKLNFLLQPSEIFIFLFLMVSFFYGTLKLSFDKYDKLALGWLLFNLIPLINIGFSKELLIEFLKPLVLFLLYLSVRGFIEKNGFKKTVRPYFLGVAIACSFAILGWFLNYFGIENVLVWQMQDYPYFGPVARARAFTATPNMLGSFIMMAVFLAVYFICNNGIKLSQKRNKLLIGFFIFSFLLVVSKTIVVLGAALMIFLSLHKFNNNFKLKILCQLSAVSLFLIYIIGSHIVVDFNGGKKLQGSQNLGYVAEGKVYNGIYVAPTAYSVIKFGSLAVFREHPFFGVGSGQFIKQYSYLQEKGIYNQTITAYDPHCTLLGTLAELGIFAGIYLFVLFIVILIDLRRSFVIKDISPEILLWGKLFFCLLIAIGVESMVTDVMNFRHYWLLYGMISYFLVNFKDKKWQILE